MGLVDQTVIRPDTASAQARHVDRLDLALRGSHGGYWEYCVPTDELYLSSRCRDILGCIQDHFTPTLNGLLEMCHPDDVAQLNDAIQACLSGRHGHTFDVEHRVRAHSGGWRWMRTRAVAGVTDTTGCPKYLGGAIVDITDRKDAEEELRDHGELLDAMVAQRTMELAETNAQLQVDIARREQAEHALQSANKDLEKSYHAQGEHVRMLMRLVEFCRSIGVSQSVDDVLRHMLHAVADLARSRRAVILMPDDDGAHLVVRQALGIESNATDNLSVPIGAPIAGKVFASGHPIVVNTAEELHSHAFGHNMSASVPLPLASIPLDASSNVVGVLHVDLRDEARPFASDELDYLEMTAKIAATAIHDILTREAHDRASDSIMVALAKLAEHRDSDTGRHLDRVTQYSLVLAEDLRKVETYRDQIDDTFLHSLERAVPLHDIGKVGIPDHILLEPGRLSDEQMDIMRRHTLIGARTIQTLIAHTPGVAFLEMAAEVAQCHHEQWNGTGYPLGLRGEAIPLSARITSLADVYDALTTERVYKAAYSHKKSTAIILEQSGRQFDPAVVDAFLRNEHILEVLSETMADPPGTNRDSESTASQTIGVAQAGQGHSET